jgi:AcrR family transcriptional regulator
MTPRQRVRREGLIVAGLALLESEEYDRIQVKDVSDRAGVSLGTLYNYFSSKERLFAEVLIRWADALPDSITSRPFHPGSPADRLMEAVHRALQAFERQPQMARLLNGLVLSTDSYAGEVFRRMDRGTSDAYMQALALMDPVLARKVVDVVNPVFSVALREWSLGRLSMGAAHDRLDTTIRLLLPGNR